jgi:hypothetical protein
LSSGVDCIAFLPSIGLTVNDPYPLPHRFLYEFLEGTEDMTLEQAREVADRAWSILSEWMQGNPIGGRHRRSPDQRRILDHYEELLGLKRFLKDGVHSAFLSALDRQQIETAAQRWVQNARRGSTPDGKSTP